MKYMIKETLLGSDGNIQGYKVVDENNIEINLSNSELSRLISVGAIELNMQGEVSTGVKIEGWHGNFITGDQLHTKVERSTKLNKRKQYAEIVAWVENQLVNKEPMILALHGLRRTGKTTLMHQVCNYFDTQIKCAYAEMNSTISSRDLIDKIHTLVKEGYKLIVIDEITEVNGFLSWVSYLADTIATLGIAVIISGTQSYEIKISEKKPLFDRVKLIDTTFISIKEFSRIFNTTSILDYIKFGGIMYTTREKENDLNGMLDYIDTAVSYNIDNTLKDATIARIKLKDGYLTELDSNELKTLIATLLEATSLEKVESSISKKFDDKLLRAASNILFKGIASKDVINKVAIEDPWDGLHSIIAIPDKYNKQEVLDTITELVEVLKEMSILTTIKCISRRAEKKDGTSELRIHNEICFNQPSLRYELVIGSMNRAKTRAMLELMQSGVSKDQAETEVKQLVNKIISIGEGNMIEEAIKVNMQNLYGDTYDMYQYRFIVAEQSVKTGSIVQKDGEIDIVVEDRLTNKKVLFEIKRSDEIDVVNQCYWLTHPYLEKILPNVTDRYVLYNGKDTEVVNRDKKVKYRNIHLFFSNSVKE